MNYHTHIAGLQNKVKLNKIEPKTQSILKKPNNSQNNKTRIDLNGNPICTSSKKYSINFKQNLCQVYVVENWKKFNILENSIQILEAEQNKKCLYNCNLF
ncbi:unnamed protein product (macronuclear) [Paramecium tetraurelia]|uniref:Uncharacterized protein n=1 Tax=Paramecium tetraurelia TaxID=5888 RepID=A0BB70_PARTE|nr:uncharacterized protein GSPATT00000222001 [Paramecium tetraurelia]CAK55787.1 unnamed protein product [Paramecium tetraurelia]|eukprot:XP_001423185.1 hypothetical protein (macronuclear) [Paramecium tetraurelia strain d4-2]